MVDNKANNSLHSIHNKYFSVPTDTTLKYCFCLLWVSNKKELGISKTSGQPICKYFSLHKEHIS